MRLTPCVFNNSFLPDVISNEATFPLPPLLEEYLWENLSPERGSCRQTVLTLLLPPHVCSSVVLSAIAAYSSVCLGP